MSYTREQLEAMPDRERDVVCAEVAMGWRVLDTSNAGRVLWHESHGPWGNPPAPWTTGRKRDGDSHWSVYVPEYSIDWSEAGEVLGRMKDTNRNAFMESLCHVLHIRDTDYSTIQTADMVVFGNHAAPDGLTPRAITIAAILACQQQQEGGAK